MLVTLFLFAENFFFLAVDLLEAAFIVLTFLFAVFRADFFRAVRFFLFGIRAVYQIFLRTFTRTIGESLVTNVLLIQAVISCPQIIDSGRAAFPSI